MFNFTNRNNLTVLRADLDAAVKAVAEKHGIAIRTGNLKYMAESCTVALECSDIAQDGTVVTKEAWAFRTLAHLYNLNAEDLGRSFFSNGKTFVITGLKPSAPKFPILARCAQDGKTYKFPEARVALALSK